MAVDAKQTLGHRTVSRRRELRDRILILLAAVLLIAGIVVFFQSRADKAQTSTAPSAQKTPAQLTPTVEPGGRLDADARRTAVTFIRTTLAREDLQTAWNLATPELRSGVTKKQWLRGEMPFPPFPIANLETSGFNVLGTTPNEIMLEVLLVPKPNSGYVPTRYEVTLERKGAKTPWKVSYFLPYAPPGMYTEGN